MRLRVLARDGDCIARRVDPGAGACRDAYGTEWIPSVPIHVLEMDYVRHGATGARHELESDHVTLCPGHHRGTGPAGGWLATSHREELREWLDRHGSAE